ncbi:MAG: phosphoribosylanthranilate isomerase [Chloroflexota bacterium]
MHIQIYTMQTPEEAQAVADLGVDHVGFAASDVGFDLPGEIDIPTAQAIVAAVKGRAKSVAISVDNDLAAIQAMVEAVQPDILHLCGLEGDVLPEAVEQLRTRLPGMPIMQAISVGDAKAIDLALAYEPVSDYLILDTQAPDIGGIGASGATHDWGISAEIVRRLQIPVILAGGLSPENVAESVAKVKPWGVDSLTHTNQNLPDGAFRKDLERVKQFVKNALGAV